MHVGMWGLAVIVIVIVIVSWLLYRYLAPQSWKEWTRAGVVQAFVIAFYAEMYGFPLTIYFLARYFGLDLQWGEGGNLWAQVFGSETVHIVAMVIGYAIVFSGATLVVDGWRRIHRARREEKLMTDGVYARMRHPQYTGLFLIVFGEGVVHWPTIVSVAAFPIPALVKDAYVKHCKRSCGVFQEAGRYALGGMLGRRHAQRCADRFLQRHPGHVLLLLLQGSNARPPARLRQMRFGRIPKPRHC